MFVTIQTPVNDVQRILRYTNSKSTKFPWGRKSSLPVSAVLVMLRLLAERPTNFIKLKFTPIRRGVIMRGYT